jgi:hypothetical protein
MVVANDPVSELYAAIEADGMVIRDVEVATREVVFLKSVFEAYPGIAIVLARPAVSQGKKSARSSVAIATTVELSPEVDGVLAELAASVGLTAEGSPDRWSQA